MRLVCISDIHGKHKKLSKRFRNQMPKGDVLVCSGDITPSGELSHMMSFIKWLSNQDYKYKVVVAGNHDFCFQNQHVSIVKEELKNHSIIYLEDKFVNIDGVSFYGSPWQPEFRDWAFNLPRGEKLLEKWRKIPSNIDVLITHGPPFGIMDLPERSKEHCGCEDLKNEIFNRIHPKIHVFGHIHNCYGIEECQGTKFINSSVLNDNYILSNDPIIVDLDKKEELDVE